MIENETLCYVIQTEPRNLYALGRVVTVIGPALPRPQRGNILAHEIDAEWLRVEYPRCRYFARPRALLPIAGPGKPPLVTRKREPETA